MPQIFHTKHIRLIYYYKKNIYNLLLYSKNYNNRNYHIKSILQYLIKYQYFLLNNNHIHHNLVIMYYNLSMICYTNKKNLCMYSYWLKNYSKHLVLHSNCNFHYLIQNTTHCIEYTKLQMNIYYNMEEFYCRIGMCH